MPIPFPMCHWQQQAASGGIPLSGLIGAWLFDEGSGALAVDSINGNHATPASGTGDWVSSPDGPAISTSNSYWRIDGGANVTPAVLKTAHQTIAMRARWPALNYSTATFALGDDSGLLFAHHNNSAANWLFYRRSGGWASASLDAATYIGVDTWRWVVQTYDGTAIRVYVDGIERGSAAASGSLTYSASGQPNAIGKYYAELSVQVKRLFIWDRALAANEVADLTV